ncbi:MAG TPA: glycoside hydrolase family 3 N-terminal domain-containing protein, partial [Ktedonobacteraceae bacterium]|nr:glycoside hydrolase family 3 N-terminal domain-containing protein [Ktedonobacteraceae bacterium]
MPTATTAPAAVGRPAKPKPSESVNEAALRKQLDKAQHIMQGMSLQQKLGQLIVVEYLGTSYTASGLQEMIAQQYVGGFMYQASNHNFEAPYNTEASVNALSAQTMKDARIPLLIATDQEGGLVNRLSAFHGYLPSAQQMADSGDPNTALTQGTQAAKWLLDLGINSDLAPVVDVHTVDPPVLETRMFGRNPQTVA